LLKTVSTCYNGNYANCGSEWGGTPVSQIDQYTYLPGVSQPSLSETFHNTAELPTQDNEFDFGVNTGSAPTTTPVRATKTVYASIGSNILNHPSCVQVTGGTSPSTCGTVTSTTKSITNYLNYNAQGNIGMIQRWVSGSKYLSSSFTYLSSGLVNTAIDVNGTSTSYQYNDCNGSYPTQITTAGLSTTYTWDCNGAVVTQTTDPNQQPIGYTYNDPFWRMKTMTDAEENVTNYSYTATTSESALNFNGTTSTVDNLAATDGFGRRIVAQTRQAQGSSSFDSTQTSYGWTTTTSTLQGGPYTKASVPYSGSAGQAAPGGTAVTTTQQDALGRALTVTDGGSGTVSYQYVSNDVLQTVGPSPSGENAKKRQFEYDGLGRLTSVCEVTAGTSSWPGGNCAQTNPQTGYWTKYTYDGLGRLTSVTQNAQSSHSQTRTFAYDGLNRLTSETNPETGTTTYTYDTDATCGGPYNGDLVKRIDALNNVTCYKYDALHRQTSVTYPSGPYAATTASKTFVYDTTTFTCTNGANVAGRLAEAFTGPSTAKITDEAFCYSPRGETTDVYESTPHSGGYYNIPMTYWANGLIETFGPFLSDPQLTYTPDGEGRIGAIADLGLSVPSITYATPTGQPTGNQPAQIQTSCVGSTCYPITYQYDPNTLRMTGYSAALNGGTVSGALSWNPNGSLRQLVITDPFNSADAQTCTYGADDLSRIASVNCLSGSTNVWNQNFTYDAFGNITKQVPTGGTGISWIPGYNASTNRYTLGGTSYDADGNVTNDTFNTYTWDAEGKLLSEEGYTFIYDAFGHEVEWLSSGTYELSYITIGNYKLSATGQSPFYAEYPYPGGSLSSDGGGLTAAQMADWLGTTRAIYSYSGGNWIKSIAHAPFGETYVGNAQNFTGQWSDADTVNTTYYFPERQYRSSQGRWLSPDPAGVSAADPSNPQSWNRYAYVLNNPLASVDPSGMYCAYLNDAGDGVQEIDDDGDDQGCRDSGGYWLSGSYGGGSWVNINVNSGTVMGLGYDSSGNAEVGVAGAMGSNNWGAWTQTFASAAATPGANNGFTWAWSSTKSFLSGFSFFGPKNDPRPSCFGQFLGNTSDGFVGSFLPPPSMGEIVGVGTATYDYANEVGIVAQQHLVQYGSRISNYTIGEQAAVRAGTAGLLANLDYQAGVAVLNEWGASSSGQCK